MDYLAQIDINTIGGGITAVATLLLAILTCVYVILTGKLLRAQTRPCVIVRVVHDELAPSLLLLHVENVGRGVAYDLSFHPDRAIPIAAFGIERPPKDAPIKTMADGPLINGIPALGPGDRRVFNWGQYGGLQHALGDRPLIIYVKYNDGRRDLIDKSVVDAASFEGTDASDRNPARACAKQLESIAKEMARWSSSGMLRVNNINIIDEQERKRKIIEENRN